MILLFCKTQFPKNELFCARAKKAKKLLSLSEEEYHLMRVACRVHIEKNFTVERMAEEHEKLYKGILGG